MSREPAWPVRQFGHNIKIALVTGSEATVRGHVKTSTKREKHPRAGLDRQGTPETQAEQRGEISFKIIGFYPGVAAISKGSS